MGVNSDSAVEVALTADFSSLQTGMRGGADAVRQGTEQMREGVVGVGRDLGILDDILAKNTKTMQQLAEQESALDRLQKANQVSATDLASAFKNLDEAEGRLAGKANLAAGALASVNKAGHNTGLITAGVAREVGVLGNELASGNFNRMEGSLIVMANRLGAMPALLSPVGLAIGAVVVAAGGLIAAFEQSSEREQEFTRITQETGGAIGVTQGQFDAMATNMANGTTSLHIAEQALGGLAESGRFSGEELGKAGQAAVDMALVTNRSMEDCVQAIVRLREDPVKAVMELNDKYNFLNGTQLEEINRLDEMGDHLGAAKLAFELYSDAMHQRATDVSEQVDWLSQKFGELKNAAIEAWRAIGDSLRQMIEGKNESDKLDDMLQKMNTLRNQRDALQNMSTHNAANNQRIGELNREIAAMGKQYSATVLEQQARVQTASAQAEQRRQSTEAVAEQLRLNKATSDGLDLQQRIAAAKKTAEQVHRDNPNSQLVSGMKFDAKGALIGGQQWNAELKKLQQQYDRVGVSAEHAHSAAASAAKKAANEAHRAALQSVRDANQAMKFRQQDAAELKKEIAAEVKSRHDADMQELNDTKKIEDAKRDTRRAALADDLASKKLTAKQVLLETQKLDQEQFEADQAYYKRKAELDKGDEKAVKSDLAQIAVAREKQRQADLKAEAKYHQDLQKQWQATAKKIEQTMGGALKGILVQGQSWKQIMGGLLTQFADMGIDQIMKVVFKHWTGEGMKTEATVAGNAARTASDVASTQTSMALTSQKGVQSIMTSGAEVIGRVWSSIAAIPYVGPFLAPAMALAAGAAVYKLVGSVPSASGGWDRVPADTLANIHKDEMVLPADLAQGVRDMARMGGGGGGGDHYHINAFDPRGFKEYMRRNPGGVAAGIQHARRRGHLPGA